MIKYESNQLWLLPTQYLVDIENSGGYYVWRDTVLMENMKCLYGKDGRNLKTRMRHHLKKNRNRMIINHSYLR